MNSLADHNRQQMELYRLAPSTKLNISCDECGGELCNPGRILTSPPARLRSM